MRPTDGPNAQDNASADSCDDVTVGDGYALAPEVDHKEHVPSSILVDIDPTNSHSFLQMLVRAVFGSYPAVVEVLARPLQSSLHVMCAKARYKTFAHSAPASFFTRAVYSFSTNILTCFFVELFRKTFPRYVSANLVGDALESSHVFVI